MIHHSNYYLQNQEGTIKQAVFRLGKVKTGKVWLLAKTWRDVNLSWTNHPGNWNACKEPDGWEIRPAQDLGIKTKPMDPRPP